MILNEMTVTIPLYEYRELIQKVARYELLEEQKQKQEEEMKKWMESGKKEGTEK